MTRYRYLLIGSLLILSVILPSEGQFSYLMGRNVSAPVNAVAKIRIEPLTKLDRVWNFCAAWLDAEGVIGLSGINYDPGFGVGQILLQSVSNPPPTYLTYTDIDVADGLPLNDCYVAGLADNQLHVSGADFFAPMDATGWQVVSISKLNDTNGSFGVTRVISNHVETHTREIGDLQVIDQVESRRISDNTVIYSAATVNGTLLIGMVSYSSSNSIESVAVGPRSITIATFEDQWVVCSLVISTTGCVSNFDATANQPMTATLGSNPSVSFIDCGTIALVSSDANGYKINTYAFPSMTLLHEFNQAVTGIKSIHHSYQLGLMSVLYGNSSGVFVDVWNYTAAQAPCGGSPSISPLVVSPQQSPQSSQSPQSPQSPVIGTPESMGVDGAGFAVAIGVGVSVPVAALAAGIFLLVFFLRKRKRNNKKKTVNQTTNPAVELENVKPVDLPDIDKRLHIPYKSLKFEKEIGSGSYGKVYAGEWRGAKVAIKVNNQITDVDGFLAEAKLTLNIAPHPNLVQTFGVSLDGPNPCIVLEFCGGGSLDKLLYDTDTPLPVEKQREYAMKIAYGLDHLHKSNIVHRDLAARNILLTSEGQLKISDFGMSRLLQTEGSKGQTKTSFGPIRWMAPESLNDQSYSTASDIWTYGIVVSEIVSRQEPHVTENQLNIAVKIRDEAVTPQIPSDADPLLVEVIDMCLKANPNDRPVLNLFAILRAFK